MPLEDLLFWEELPEDRQRTLREQLAQDPEFATRWRAWNRLWNALYHHLNVRSEDRRLLILYTLQKTGYRHVLTPEELEELRQHETHLQNLSEQLEAFPQLLASIQRDIETFEEVWKLHTPTSLRHTRRRLPVRIWHIAALSLIVLMGVLMWNYLQYRQDFVEIVASERQTVSLPDGSQVILHPTARIAYHPEYPRRVRFLEGKALFEVLTRPQPAFVVQTPVAYVTVTGTTFGVETSESATRVVLARGRVQVSPRHKPEETITLEPGQFTEVVEDQPPTPPRRVDITRELAWTGMLFFHQVPLSRLIRTLEDRYGVRILVDEQLAQEEVTATLEAEQPIEEIIQALALTLGAKVEQLDARTFRLTRKES